MLIKCADDQSKRIALLETLQQSPLLDGVQRQWLDDELWALRLGRSGERSAAHYIDSHYKDSPNLAVIHDLRLECEGDIAQIDHLIISRGFMFYLLETKNFSGDLSINEHGEFSVFYRTRGRRGIPSPLEQSRRHEKVLAKCLERLEITGRFSSKPQFFHVVLIDPKGNIQRPDVSKFDTGNVIKADQFEAWRSAHVDKGMSFTQSLAAMANLRSGETVREWAQMLVREHRPADPLWLPDFMKPRAAAPASPVTAVVQPDLESGRELKKPPVCAHCGAEISFAEANFCRKQSAMFRGATYCREHQTQFRADRAPDVLATSQPSAKSQVRDAHGVNEPTYQPKRLVCEECGVKISRPEGLFCWNNPRRFGGLQYCRAHQAMFKS